MIDDLSTPACDTEVTVHADIPYLPSLLDYARVFRITRVAKKLSQKDLADRLEVSPSYVSLLESGERTPSTAVLENLSKALGIPMSLLMLLAAGKSQLRGLSEEEAQVVGKTLLRFLLDDDAGKAR